MTWILVYWCGTPVEWRKGGTRIRMCPSNTALLSWIVGVDQSFFEMFVWRWCCLWGRTIVACIATVTATSRSFRKVWPIIATLRSILVVLPFIIIVAVRVDNQWWRRGRHSECTWWSAAWRFALRCTGQIKSWRWYWWARCHWRVGMVVGQYRINVVLQLGWGWRNRCRSIRWSIRRMLLPACSICRWWWLLVVVVRFRSRGQQLGDAHKWWTTTAL